MEIYAGNLPYDVTRKDLAKLFGAYGEVVSARVIQNRLSGKSRGYGFLEMSDRAEAAAAVQAMNGKELKGRKLVVNEAKANNRRQRRGGR
ncbi:MAG: RNA-binding protein [Lentisphaerae bacterium]|nr:RNA-binding protein [Lentisphaerota bacterium]